MTTNNYIRIIGNTIDYYTFNRIIYKTLVATVNSISLYNNCSREDKMPSIQGKYQHYKNEDLDDYFIAIGVPYIGRKMMAMSSPLMEIIIEGEMMTIKSSSLVRTTSNTFKIGEQYDDKMPDATIQSVTTILNDNEIETKSVYAESEGTLSRHYLFTDDECVVTMTHMKAKKPAKRYYKRVK